MMTPLRFEQLYAAEWTELEALLDAVLGRKTTDSVAKTPESGARLAALYRRACEHLALARARAYPAYVVTRLERLTSEAHQRIYQQRELGAARLLRVATLDFPRTVRAHKWYMYGRQITVNDIYSFDPSVHVELEEFTDIIGRNFKQPSQGLGYDNSPVAHMWRAMIRPAKYL